MRRRKSLGLAFKDELFKVSQTHGHFRKEKIQDQEWKDLLIPNYQEEDTIATASPWRLVAVACLFIFTFFGIFLRLFHLQVVKGEENRERADYNRVFIRPIHAPRGVIYDRNGVVLADSSPGFRLDKKFITRDEALVMEAKDNAKFHELEIDAVRNYPLGEVAAHVVGYVGQISDKELESAEYKDYKSGDRIGRSGIEQVYEKVLRGKDGAEIIEVDATGKKLRTLRTIDPIPGSNIHLSVDAGLQKASYEALKEGVEKAKSCCGAAVAEDPKTGEVLAMVSFPSFDANDFTDPGKNDDVEKYFKDRSSPMLNRAIAGVYPPGSTFKISSALAALDSGKISASTKFEDTGVVNLGPYKFANWYFTQYGATDGWVDVTKALQRSNDIYFYKVGEIIGEKKMGEVAGKMGMGKKLGVDLPGEADGLIPDGEWKKKAIGEIWYPGDNLHMAIGQGFLLTTPVQVLAQTAFVANNGSLIQPHLATRITSPDGTPVKEFRFEPLVKDIFKKEHINVVKKGLEMVPVEGGTAWPFFTFTVPTAGKTGTAEFGDPKGKTHAWYTAYAPLKSPEITTTVLVEAGGEGSSVSAPIAKKIFNWYFNPDKKNIISLDSAPASSSAKMVGD